MDYNCKCKYCTFFIAMEKKEGITFRCFFELGCVVFPKLPEEDEMNQALKGYVADILRDLEKALKIDKEELKPYIKEWAKLISVTQADLDKDQSNHTIQ